jgi:hypothetical protein
MPDQTTGLQRIKLKGGYCRSAHAFGADVKHPRRRTRWTGRVQESRASGEGSNSGGVAEAATASSVGFGARERNSWRWTGGRKDQHARSIERRE